LEALVNVAKVRPNAHLHGTLKNNQEAAANYDPSASNVSDFDFLPPPALGGQSPAELTVVDDRGFLVTRTYNVATLPKTFRDHLAVAENPLLLLYTEYKACLPLLAQTRLLNSSVWEDRISAGMSRNSTIHNFLRSMLDTILKVSLDCDTMLSMMGSCESLVKSLVAMVQSTPNRLSTKVFVTRLHEMHSLLGDVQATKVMVDLMLHEYRVFFERINAVSSHELSNLLRESEDVRLNYKYFLSCQGKVVELFARLKDCKALVAQHRLHFIQPVVTQGYSSGQGGMGDDDDNKNKKNNNNSSNTNTSFGALASELQQLRDEKQTLEEQLADAAADLEDSEAELVEVQQELFEALQAQDRTPGALLFFATMHDPATVESLQQVVLQVQALKKMLGGKEHVDFVTLKSRVQVCATMCPAVEKLLDRYFYLYKRWSEDRLAVFRTRRLTGGSSDAAALCALCHEPKRDADRDAIKPTTKKLKSLADANTSAAAAEKNRRKAARKPSTGSDNAGADGGPESSIVMGVSGRNPGAASRLLMSSSAPGF